ncbi:MAG: hypothetical protein C0508_09790 [Cyanobacteria bacterium PR.023]|nr:hypothetical protein [Cyanobacteria bacterium PR.023]
MLELLSAELLSIRLRAPRLGLNFVALSIVLATVCLALPGASSARPTTTTTTSTTSSSSSRGQATQYNAAMSLYNTANYAQALSAFEAIARKSPTDDTAHYYIALCCQSLHQNSRAALEYRYVASASRNLQMRQMAQKGYDSLTRLQSAAVAQATPSSPAVPVGASPASAVVRGSRVKKVIEFYTTWCHVCNEFADTFERTKAKYSGRIQFEQLNAEEPENSELKAKYNVKAYPTLIYLDASGSVLRRGEGAPMGPNFGNIIESL